MYTLCYRQNYNIIKFLDRHKNFHIKNTYFTAIDVICVLHLRLYRYYCARNHRRLFTTIIATVRVAPEI